MREELKAKIAASRDRLHAWHREWPNGAVMWSGGKDSTAMLHLMRSCGIILPVIHFREPRFRKRYAFADILIAEWDLEVHDWTPGRYAIADGLDIHTGEPRFDFLKYYQMGPTGKALVLSLGTEPPAPGEPFLCAVKDLLQRPTGSFNFPWQVIYHGQKSADVDLIKGHVPLAQDVRIIPDFPVQCYPMLDWTDEDIWEYHEAHGIPIDTTRYGKDADGKWDHLPDKSLNADYYPVCFNCINRHLGPVVHCPKMGSAITNLPDRAPYVDVVIPEQGFRPAWSPESGFHPTAAQ